MAAMDRPPAAITACLVPTGQCSLHRTLIRAPQEAIRTTPTEDTTPLAAIVPHDTAVDRPTEADLADTAATVVVAVTLPPRTARADTAEVADITAAPAAGVTTARAAGAADSTAPVVPTEAVIAKAERVKVGSANAAYKGGV